MHRRSDPSHSPAHDSTLSFQVNHTQHRGSEAAVDRSKELEHKVEQQVRSASCLRSLPPKLTKDTQGSDDSKRTQSPVLCLLQLSCPPACDYG
jgi:hypothetical protein